MRWTWIFNFKWLYNSTLKFQQILWAKIYHETENYVVEMKSLSSLEFFLFFFVIVSGPTWKKDIYTRWLIGHRLPELTTHVMLDHFMSLGSCNPVFLAFGLPELACMWKEFSHTCAIDSNQVVGAPNEIEVYQEQARDVVIILYFHIWWIILKVENVFSYVTCMGNMDVKIRVRLGD